MTTARDSLELATHLNAIAEDLFALRPDDPIALMAARRIHELAKKDLVILPHINPEHDQVDHWTRLSDHRLNSEINADAWNLAAGLYVARDRATRQSLRDTS
ncbi:MULTISPECIES: hypothetical protein [Pseudonocardia]|uniref:Uncharacterized protein n=2 Tax=Pseudonocardia TaxID=1847 RepID=A0A1Y2MM02_PSEAH|nr:MULTISPECIES: hypothetical protein [Pseudonocardia]OSY36091.1 hypothetical protein BG845_05606 [Pseudonocardia autotrophica]TDN77572.1 hypothetical protein C8E95_6821 [Pseudonocardia autotrophica]BBG01601.1 hypothetical protein Pdca_28100 [Pseudonocardia autotrophica]GEC25346.1 hypothetical protein PSA01_23750 [Pseudonocardia saturnea]